MALTSDSPASITVSRALSLALGQGGGRGVKPFYKVNWQILD